MKRTLAVLALMLVGIAGFTAVTFAVDAPGEHVACATATAVASIPDTPITLYTTPISTVPGQVTTATQDVCVTATDQTVTAPGGTVTLPGQTVTQTVTVTTGTTTAPPPPPPPGCTSTISSGLQSAIQNAAAGSTICLNAGSYGAVTLSGMSKSSDVTVQPVSDASATVGYVSLTDVSHLRFTSDSGTLSIAGATIDPSSTLPNCSDHLSFDHLRFSAPVDVRPRCAAMALLFDHLNMNNLPAGNAGEGRLNFQALDQGPSSDQGITVSNSTFNGGCSKGMQVLGGTYGIEILNNEFAFEPDQSQCTIHIGGIQLYGTFNAHIKGNYFHDNGTSAGGLSMPADGAIRANIEDNVWVCTCIYPWSIQAAATENSVVRHNTFAGGGGIHFYVEQGMTAFGNHVYDNVFTDPSNGITWDSGTGPSAWGTQDHNLNSGLSGVGNLAGIPVFVGGGSTSSYNNWYLSGGTIGTNAASDGLDMGIRH